MDFFHHAQSQQKRPPKHSNKRGLTHDQVRLLERAFTTTKKLEPELKLELANQLGVPPKQVAIWYQNRRARWKTQSLELDHRRLQVKLENALADKRRLEREVVQLRDELREAQIMAFAFSPEMVPSHPAPSPLPFHSCFEGGSLASLHEDVNGEVLQFDELYACLIGSG